MNSYKPNDIVEYKLGLLKGKGKVVGKTAPQASMGEMIIIEDLSGNLPNKQYRFTHFAAPESCLKRVGAADSSEKNKFLEWNEEIVRLSKSSSLLRKGQCWMNALCNVDKKLHDEIAGGEFDCYYNDDRCDKFVERLVKEWVCNKIS